MIEKVKAQLDMLIERYPQLAVCKDDITKAYEIIETCYANGGKPSLRIYRARFRQ